MRRIIHKVTADLIGDKLGQCRVCLAQPATVCNAVGDVFELFGRHAVRFGEHGIFDDFAVQTGHAVYRVTRRNAKVCHFDLTVADNCHTADLFYVAAGLFHHFFAVTVIDFFHDLVNAGQTTLEQVFRPTFQRFGHNRMVGVGKHAFDDIPRIVPGVTAFVQHNTHQFGNGQGRVGIVDMHRRHFGQVIQRTVLFQMALYDILNGCGNEEILLRQAQRLAFSVVIRGIQYLRDNFGHGFLFHCAHIFALIKQRHIHTGRGGFPQAQGRYRLAVFARYHQVIRLSNHHGSVVVLNMMEIFFVPPFAHVTVKTHFFGKFGTGQQPALAAGQPEIGHFRLPTVHQFLTENTVFI